MAIKKKPVKAFLLLKRNWKPIAAFEVLYKLITALLVTPLLSGMLKISIRLAGLSYISNDTLEAYLRHPATILMLLAILLIFAFVNTFDMSAVICSYNASYFDEDISVTQMFRAGLSEAPQIFQPRNWFAILFVLLVVQIVNALALSGYASYIQAPEYIEDFILANRELSVLAGLTLAALFLFAFRRGLSMHTFILENVGFGEASRRCRTLMRKRYAHIGWSTLAWWLIIALCSAVIAVLLTAAAFAVIHFFCAESIQFTAAAVTLYVILTALSLLLLVLSVPLVFAHLSVEYYQCKRELQQEIPKPVAYKKLRMSAGMKGALTALFILGTLGTAAVITTQQYTGAQELRNVLNRPQIAAHRGSSAQAPENSIPAFQKAIEEGADWIELDVHQTKDGVVVVTHDESIKRIAGVDKKVWELTYEELRQYDVGSWFSPEFKGLRVAKLDEVLKLCKGRIKLNIELKPTGHEPDFERHVIDVVKRNGYPRNTYILASLNADTLRNIKSIDPKIDTLFIMAIAAGNIMGIPFADAFSIEETYITESLVNKVHAAGKEIHAWTVNREENVENMMALRVDCIITDNPTMAFRVVTTGRMQDATEEITALFFKKEEVVIDPQIADSP